MIKFIINLFKNKKRQHNTPVVVSSNSYELTNYELNKMKELKSDTVRFTSGGGIGVGVECLVGKKWVDITDYDCW